MPTSKTTKYFEGVGRRKTAVARVRLFPQTNTEYIINEKKLEEYFPISELQNVARSPIENGKPAEKFLVSVKVNGGGISAQAGAVRHGIARALIIYDTELRGKVKKLGYLKRDPRAKERRKFGRKKARKSPQWSKR